MTEFTLEELKDLMYYTVHYMECKWTDQKSLQLEKKLQGMIENYESSGVDSETRRQ